MAITFSRPPSGTAPATWVATPALAGRRHQAFHVVSPGRINRAPSGTGSVAPCWAGPRCGAGGTTGVAAARSPDAAKLGTGSAAAGFAGVAISPTRGPLTGSGRLDRRDGLRPNSRRSHRRMASRPILMPSTLKPELLERFSKRASSATRPSRPAWRNSAGNPTVTKSPSSSGRTGPRSSMLMSPVFEPTGYARRNFFSGSGGRSHLSLHGLRFVGGGAPRL